MGAAARKGPSDVDVAREEEDALLTLNAPAYFLNRAARSGRAREKYVEGSTRRCKSGAPKSCVCEAQDGLRAARRPRAPGDEVARSARMLFCTLGDVPCVA